MNTFIFKNLKNMFTNQLLPAGRRTPTLFETFLKQCGIKHELIAPYTPRNNDKVERSTVKRTNIFMPRINSIHMMILKAACCSQQKIQSFSHAPSESESFM